MALQRICHFLVILTLRNVGGVPRVFPLDDDASPVVQTSVGSIRGLRAEDGDYSMFLGVPYAEVDKDNPFGASLPYPRFEETFDAFDDSAICPQREEFNHTIAGTLDCLHLNIFVPDSASVENPLPVMVWIYGGIFTVGFHNRYLYGARYLAKHDVILVTVNYRLGPYGFMCLDIPEVPGNQGLKDQLKAMRWVKEHIAAFGGDDSRITLAGNSAGAMSVDFHLYFNQEQLFHRLIPQSGVAVVSSAVRESSPTSVIQLAEYFSYTPSDHNDAISFLASIDPLELIAGSQAAGLNYRPCIEKKFDGVERFITGHPVNLKIERVKDIDVLIGLTNDELYANYANLGDDHLLNLDIVDTQFSNNFVFDEEYEHREEMKEIVTNFYFGGNDRTIESIPTVIDVVSDFHFNHPIQRTVKKYLDNGVENLYMYMFSYVGGRNFARIKNNVAGGGAAHGDEIGYLFDISYMEEPLTPEDQIILDRMTELWANFIKYGNPTPAATELVPLQWPRLTHEQWYYLEIDTEMTVSTRPMHRRMAFLDLFYKTNEEYQLGFERESSAGNAAKRNIVFNISLPFLFTIKYFI